MTLEINETHQPIRLRRAVGCVAALSLLTTLPLVITTMVPLREGFVVGGREAVAEKLTMSGARVEDFVPGEHGKLRKRIVMGLLAGAAGGFGERLATAFVNGSWPVFQGFIDRTTRRTDLMVLAGPDHFADEKPVGRDDTVLVLKLDGNLASAYRLSRLYSSWFGLDVGKFRMSGSAQRKDCTCGYHSHGDEIEVSTSGLIRQSWVSDKMRVKATVVANMDADGQTAAGTVTTSFGHQQLERPVVLGSSYNDLQADTRLNP